MLSRVKFQIDSMVNRTLDQLSPEVWTSKTTTFFDPGIGGGQFVNEIEKRLRVAGHSEKNIAKRVVGCEELIHRVQYAVNKYKLSGNYKASDILKWNTKMQGDVITVGNPPYNGPGQGKPPIYHLITERMANLVQPKEMAWVTQYNWITQTSKVGRIMRDSLLKMGVWKIEDNRFDAFDNATVRTCNIYCRAGYDGDIELKDMLSGQSIHVTRAYFKKHKIPPVYDQGEWDLLHRIKTLGLGGHWSTSNLARGNRADYAIITSYFADFVKGAINKIRLVGGNTTEVPGCSRVFAGYDHIKTSAEGDQLLEYFNSYWTSRTVKFIINRTLTSRTLDNPQIEYVPVVPMDRVWTDKSIAQYLGLTAAEEAIIASAKY